jgi:hypothetical protein
VRLIGIVGLALLWAVVVLALGKRRLQAAAGRVAAAWSRVQDALEKRHDLGRQMVANAARPDDPPMLALHDALTQAEFVSGFAMKARAEDQLSGCLHDALAVGGDERFAGAAAALPAAFEAARRAADEYNAQVRDYNAALERQSVVARFFHYEAREEFFLKAMEGEKP